MRLNQFVEKRIHTTSKNSLIGKETHFVYYLIRQAMDKSKTNTFDNLHPFQIKLTQGIFDTSCCVIIGVKE